jgi:hypothetical protein
MIKMLLKILPFTKNIKIQDKSKSLRKCNKNIKARSPLLFLNQLGKAKTLL